jgi:hypothetical protein
VREGLILSHNETEEVGGMASQRARWVDTEGTSAQDGHDHVYMRIRRESYYPSDCKPGMSIRRVIDVGDFIALHDI